MKRPWDSDLEQTDIFVPASGVAPGSVLLRADESRFGPGWLLFRNPLSVLTADSASAVQPVLSQLEEAVEQGLYGVACISYEAAPAFDPAFSVQTGRRGPMCWVALYEGFQFYKELPHVPPAPPGEWRRAITRETFFERFAAIKEKLAAGDTYQVNFTYRLHSDAEGDLFEEFVRTVGVDPPPYAAYIDGGAFKVASFSPELFFIQDEDKMISKPMKGTARRGGSSGEDILNAERLRQAPKEQAENLMIVDMIRNDLGRIARPGSVHVDDIFKVERHPTVLQMTSTVAASVNGGLCDILSALFPCASIVGAPKIETMKIIKELEDTPRGLYCGAIGMVAPGNRSQFSVAIRTVCESGEGREFGVGSGIVWDSEPEKEWAECELKAGVLAHRAESFALLETFRWNAAEGFFLLGLHLERLAKSSAELRIRFDEQLVLGALSNAASRFDGPKRVRLLLDRSGAAIVEHQPLPRQPDVVVAELAKAPVQSSDPLLRHKTNSRGVYERRLTLSGAEEVLLWNERGELTEFSIGNLVLEIDGRLVTPPVDSGLLPGVLRQHLLAKGEIEECPLTVEELKRATKVFRINSVSEWVPVQMSQVMPSTADQSRGS